MKYTYTVATMLALTAPAFAAPAQNQARDATSPESCAATKYSCLSSGANASSCVSDFYGCCGTIKDACLASDYNQSTCISNYQQCVGQ